MKNLKNISLLALIAVFISCEKDPEPAPTTGTITGKVTNLENGSPIEGANIKSNPATSSVNADSEGEYTIPNIEAGKYFIIATKPNFISDTVEINVKAGENSQGDIALAPIPINPPKEAENNFPTPGAVDQPTTLILVWSTDDEDSDSFTYEVLFGTVNPPIESIVSEYDSTSVQIDNLEKGTTYYWQVITTNSQGVVTEGEIWEFTTSTASDPVGVFEMDFENGIGEWHADNGLWEVGTATVGPETAHSGEQVSGTVLGGDYADNANTRLISPSVSLPGIQPGEKIQLKFWHWYLFASGDKGQVQVSVDEGEWETVSDPGFDGSSPVWTQHVVDLSAYSGSNIRIAFYFTSNGAWINNGWYVDEVSVEKKVFAFNNPEDFEMGVGDWNTDNGLWQVGEAKTGPKSAHSGEQVSGTVLGGDYADNANTRLISPSVSLPGIQPGEKIQLKFWHWYLFASGDKGQVQVSVDEGEWETVSDPGFDGSSPVWTQHVVDLSAYAASNIRIAFYFTSNGAWINNGWYLDDISVEIN